MRSPYLLDIRLYILLFTTLSTFLYFMQTHIVADAFDNSADRTRVFVLIDQAVSSLTISRSIWSPAAWRAGSASTAFSLFCP